MTPNRRAVPTGSQTVGPYFRIGLEYLIERAAAIDAGARTILLRGRILDRDGAVVPDAMLEFWSAAIAQTSTLPDLVDDAHPSAFRRAATDGNGTYSVTMAKPAPLALENGQLQASHLLVLVFARGLLRHLITRVYFDDEPGNDADPVLAQIAAERRGTLIARREGHETSSYRWDVVLQGEDETVFFAW